MPWRFRILIMIAFESKIAELWPFFEKAIHINFTTKDDHSSWVTLSKWPLVTKKPLAKVLGLAMAFLNIHFEWVWAKTAIVLFLFQNKQTAAFFYSKQSHCEIDLVKSAFVHKKPVAKVVWDAMAFQNLDYDCIWVKNSRALTIFPKSNTHQFYNERRSPFLSDLVKMAFALWSISEVAGWCDFISTQPPFCS